MKLVRNICNIIFIIILILFTVAYTLQSIINVNANVSVVIPKDQNDQQILNNINSNFTFSLYVDKIVDTTDSINTTINYSDINNTIGTITNIIKYIFIVVSVCIGLLIIFSLIGLKMISYIPLAISQLVLIMTSLFIVIMYGTNYLSDIIKNYINSQSLDGIKIKITNLNINYGTGGILIFVSTALLIVTNFIYAMLA
jgi:hypothetical protein